MSSTHLLLTSLVGLLQRDTALCHYWGVEGKALECSAGGAVTSVERRRPNTMAAGGKVRW